MEPFGKLTLKLTSLGAKLNYGAFRLAMVLCLHSNSEGKCWPSIKTLLKEVSINRFGLMRARNELAEFGLKWKKRPNKATIYTWDLLKMEVSRAAPPRKNGGVIQDTLEVSRAAPPHIRNKQIIEQNIGKARTVKTLTGESDGRNKSSSPSFFKNSGPGNGNGDKWKTPADVTAEIRRACKTKARA